MTQKLDSRGVIQEKEDEMMDLVSIKMTALDTMKKLLPWMCNDGDEDAIYFSGVSSKAILLANDILSK